MQVGERKSWSSASYKHFIWLSSELKMNMLDAYIGYTHTYNTHTESYYVQVALRMSMCVFAIISFLEGGGEREIMGPRPCTLGRARIYMLPASSLGLIITWL